MYTSKIHLHVNLTGLCKKFLVYIHVYLSISVDCTAYPESTEACTFQQPAISVHGWAATVGELLRTHSTINVYANSRSQSVVVTSL